MVEQAKTYERLATLQLGHHDQEKRIRKLEQSLAAGKWTERVVWLLVSTGLVGYLKFFTFGGDK